MSDRKQVSRKKTTASNLSNPSLTPNIPSLDTPSHSLGVESHQITPQTAKLETSQEVEQVAGEQENQENISFNESAFDNTNYLQNVSFIPRHNIQRQELESEKEEHKENSEIIQAKLNTSEPGDKQEGVSIWNKAFQIQRSEDSKLDKPIESFNYLEKATIFRPQENVQRQELEEETEQQELDGIIQAKCSECESEVQQKQEEEDTKTVQAQELVNPVNKSKITAEELSQTESQIVQSKPIKPLTISSVNPHIQRFLGINIKDKIAGFANNIPGFSLLTLILGKNPITNKPVKRNPTNIIRGVLSLVPGGDSFFANLQESGALNKAFTWFQEQIAILNITWSGIKSLFRKAWNSVNILDPSGSWERIKNIFLAPIQRIKNFAIALGKKVMEFVFEGVMSKVGGGGARVMGIIQSAGKHFTNIIKNPIGFVGNLVAAVRGGFSKFSANIGTHLQNGLTGWLFGALGNAGLTLPEQFDLKGIVSIVLQVLGITYERLRTMLAKRIGEPRVAKLEQAFEFLRAIVNGGLGAAWQKITEFVGNLQETVIGGIRQWVQNSVIKAAIVKLISMFNPAGAIVQAVMAIYNTIQFFIERGSQIAALAQSVFDSIGKIAAGNVGAAANYVEQTMARTLPVMISFLARLIGLGGIGGQIRNIIKRVQAPVDKGLNRLVGFIVSKAKGLFKGKKGKGNKEENKELKQAALAGWKAASKITSKQIQPIAKVKELLKKAYKPSKLSSKIKLGISRKDKIWKIEAQSQGAKHEEGNGSVLLNQKNAVYLAAHKQLNKQHKSIIQKIQEKIQQPVAKQGKESAEKIYKTNFEKTNKLEKEGQAMLDQTIKGLKFSITTEKLSEAKKDGKIDSKLVVEPNIEEGRAYVPIEDMTQRGIYLWYGARGRTGKFPHVVVRTFVDEKQNITTEQIVENRKEVDQAQEEYKKTHNLEKYRESLRIINLGTTVQTLTRDNFYDFIPLSEENAERAYLVQKAATKQAGLNVQMSITTIKTSTDKGKLKYEHGQYTSSNTCATHAIAVLQAAGVGVPEGIRHVEEELAKYVSEYLSEREQGEDKGHENDVKELKDTWEYQIDDWEINKPPQNNIDRSFLYETISDFLDKGIKIEKAREEPLVWLSRRVSLIKSFIEIEKNKIQTNNDNIQENIEAMKKLEILENKLKQR